MKRFATMRCSDGIFKLRNLFSGMNQNHDTDHALFAIPASIAGVQRSGPWIFHEVGIHEVQSDYRFETAL